MLINRPKMVQLDFDLERDVPELTGKVILITGGEHTSSCFAIFIRYI